MEEVFRSLVGRFNESVRGYLKPSRKPSCLPVLVSIRPNIHTTSLLTNRLAETYAPKRKDLSILGETQDISENGLSFIVASIRLGEHYLVSDGTVLELEIDLPEGKLHVKAVGCRYEQIDLDCSVSRFLVGARFIEVSAKDKILLAEYLEAEKRSRKNKVKNVQWGLDLTRP